MKLAFRIGTFALALMVAFSHGYYVWQQFALLQPSERFGYSLQYATLLFAFPIALVVAAFGRFRFAPRVPLFVGAFTALSGIVKALFWPDAPCCIGMEIVMWATIAALPQVVAGGLMWFEGSRSMAAKQDQGQQWPA